MLNQHPESLNRWECRIVSTNIQNKTIGIIGGMGPLATVDLFKKIVEMTDSPADTEHLHILVDNNTNIPDRTQAILYHGTDPLPEMVRSALRLEYGGADVLVMGCNTAHYFYSDLCRFLCVPLLNMLDETAKEAHKRGISTVALLATDGTIQSGVYKVAFSKQGIRMLLPNQDEQRAVMRMIYDGVKAGVSTWEAGAIETMLSRLASQGAQVVILGCTELPIAFQQYEINSPLPLLDPLKFWLDPRF